MDQVIDALKEELSVEVENILTELEEPISLSSLKRAYKYFKETLNLTQMAFAIAEDRNVNLTDLVIVMVKARKLSTKCELIFTKQDGEHLVG
jgi:hypothetical protein